MKHLTPFFASLILIPFLLILNVDAVENNDKGAATNLKNSKSKKINVSGQVFVVTQGKDVIKLPLVHVVFIPSKLFDIHVKNKNESKEKIRESLLLEQEIAHKEMKDSLTKQEIAQKEMEDSISRNAADTSVKVEEAKLQRESVTLAYDKWASLGERVKYLDTLAFYYGDLPSKSYSTKTDADGKFNISVPSGKYVVASQSSRKVSSGDENYNWLVYVDTSTTKALMLSNDNLIESNCSACVKF